MSCHTSDCQLALLVVLSCMHCCLTLRVVSCPPCPSLQHCCVMRGALSPVHLALCCRCSGEGRVQVRRHVRIRVPAGVVDGQVLRVKGQGHSGKFGGAPGDLLVKLQVCMQSSCLRINRRAVNTLVCLNRSSSLPFVGQVVLTDSSVQQKSFVFCLNTWPLIPVK